jgi:glycerol-1-phosphate dehydrogenase [NAD(P)+]
MNVFRKIDDPTNLEVVRRAIREAPGAERLIPLGIRRLVISGRAADEVVDELVVELAIAGITTPRPTILLLTDVSKIFREGVDLKQHVLSLLQARFDVKECVLGQHGHLFADDSSLDAATEAAGAVDAVVSVGSGTISDIGKVATSRQGNMPHILIQTAASVDGYTDNVSVVLKSGAKRTIDSKWPNVVLADTRTICAAPRELNTSGFGELLSLFTAPADWWLASQIGTDNSFHETPRDLLLTFAGDPSEWGEGISEGSVDAIEQLTRVLAIRGIGTGIAGSTACLSGVEHLVSHMLDMWAASHHHEVGLHGAQVGVASLVAAAAWDHLFNKLALRSKPAQVSFDLPALESRVREAFSQCDPSGAMGEECWRDYQRKITAWVAGGVDIEALVGDGSELERRLGIMRPKGESLALGLRKAGAVNVPQNLGSWVTPDVWRWSVSHCHFMRNRVTVIDLLEGLGWWADEDIDAVILAASHAAVAS